MITFRDVSRWFGARPALRNVSLALPARGVTGVLGPNGAGKTTLFRLLTGFLSPTSGVMELDGEDLFDRPDALRRAVGSLPEQPPLYPEMTVREFLHFAADLRGVSGRRADEAGESMDLAARFDQECGQLSRGFRQRTGLAAALLADPRYLVLDEPTVGLDPEQTAELRRLVLRLGKERAVLFSSHVLGEVAAVADDLVVIADGRLLAHEPRPVFEKRLEETEIALAIETTAGAFPRWAESIAAATTLRLVSERDGEAVFSGPASGVPDLVAAAVRAGLRVTSVRAAENPLERVFRALVRTEGSDSGPVAGVSGPAA